MPLILSTTRHFGEQLREVRIAKGLSQTEVAKRMGCLPSNVSHFEKGDMSYGKGSIQSVFKYAKALGYRVVKIKL